MKKTEIKLVETSPKKVVADEEEFFVERRVLDPDWIRKNHNNQARKIALRQNLLAIIGSCIILAVCALCLPFLVYGIIVGAPQDFGLVATICYYTMFVSTSVVSVIFIYCSIGELHRIFKYEAHRYDL